MLEFRAGEHMMGETFAAAESPEFTVAVTGTNTIERIEIVKYQDGDPYPFPVVHTVQPGTQEARFTWTDPHFTKDALYYARVSQRVEKDRFKDNAFPDEKAWCSPIWVAKTAVE